MSKVLVIIKSRGIGDLCILSKYIQTISKHNSSKVSVLGSIAAGTPIEAIQQEVDKVALPEELKSNKQKEKK